MSEQFNVDNLNLRHDWVLVRLYNDGYKKIGDLTVPISNDEYTEADILAVGSNVEDLKVGQRAYIKHQKKHVRPQSNNEYNITFTPEGIRFQYQDDEDGTLMLFDEFHVIAVLSQPNETPNTGE